MRIYVRTAPFPVVARAKKGRWKKRKIVCKEKCNSNRLFFLTMVAAFSRTKEKRSFLLISIWRKETRRSIDEYFTNTYFVRDVTKKLKREINCTR